jgi:hypothetical protein
VSAGIAAAALDSEQPCKCHQSFAYIAPRHGGHCCYFPESQTCHPAEVAEWERQRDARRPQPEGNPS